MDDPCDNHDGAFDAVAVGETPEERRYRKEREHREHDARRAREAAAHASPGMPEGNIETPEERRSRKVVGVRHTQVPGQGECIATCEACAYERAQKVMLENTPIAPIEKITQDGREVRIDSAVRPAHYKVGDAYETIIVMEQWHGPEPVYWFCVLSAEKYLSRAGKKSGESAERDLAKAAWYATKAAEVKGRM